jgi:hypothetical protein
MRVGELRGLGEGRWIRVVDVNLHRYVVEVRGVGRRVDPDTGETRYDTYDCVLGDALLVGTYADLDLAFRAGLRQIDLWEGQSR